MVGLLFPFISAGQNWKEAASVNVKNDSLVKADSLKQIEIADLDGDGNGDVILLADGHLRLFKGDGNGGFVPYLPLATTALKVSTVAAVEL